MTRTLFTGSEVFDGTGARSPLLGRTPIQPDWLWLPEHRTNLVR